MKERFIIIPCPHEETVSFGKGTRRGPGAILQACKQVEWFDEELGCEPVSEDAVKIIKPVPVSRLGGAVTEALKADRTPVILGGEHSITPFAVKAFAAFFKNLSVLQLDAHADLRDSYQGKRNSHACALRRVLEICPAVQAGIRNISAEEWEWARGNGQISRIHWAKDLSVRKITRQLSDQVYLTIDVDVFDPSVVSATGTPEPGGLSWMEVLEAVKTVCREKKVVGCDLVELSPRGGDIASDFTIAKLMYKIIEYIALGGNK
jgi:agmatinase